MRCLTPALCLVLVLGCGDPLVEGDYRGQPLIELGGTVRVDTNYTLSPEDSARVRVGLLWVGAAQQDELTGRSESSFPARYSMQVYTRPPNRAMQTLPDRDGLHAVARIVLFIDEDGDDQLDSLERVVGAAPHQVLTYFTSSAPTNMVRGSIRSGYQVMEVFECDARLEDKATFGGVSDVNAVDLTLGANATDALLDLDCDTVSDDWCLDLWLQINENETASQELISLYQDRCEVTSEPEFNNNPEPSPGGDGTPNTDPDRDPNQPPDCADGNQDTNPECSPDQQRPPGDVVAECRPLLIEGFTPETEQLRESYWRFRSCVGEYDPCGESGWDGSFDGWEQYQACLFEQMPEHLQNYCRSIAEMMANGGDNEVLLEEEFIRVGCDASNI